MPIDRILALNKQMKSLGTFTLNKWHFKLGICYNRFIKRYVFLFGFFKVVSLPSEGCALGGSDIKGFLIEKEIRKDSFGISV